MGFKSTIHISSLEGIQKNAVASSIYFSQRKHHDDWNAGQVNSNNVKRTL